MYFFVDGQVGTGCLCLDNKITHKILLLGVQVLKNMKYLISNFI